MKAHPDDLTGRLIWELSRQLKRFPEAETAFEAAAKISVNRPDLIGKLSLTYLKAGIAWQEWHSVNSPT